MRRKWLAAALGATLTFSLSVTASAQTLESGQVRGIVYDETGGPLPGATVTLSNDATGYTRTTPTNASGAYVFPQLPGGTYGILVELTGFSQTQVTDLVVTAGASLTMDITLSLGALSETIVVEAAGAPVDTSRAGVSQQLSEQAIQALPLEGRDFRDLARLSPSSQVVPGLRGGLRLGGQQSDYSGLSIDGADSRDNFFGEFFGSLETKNSVVPLEAVQEFQLVTNGFAPEYGRSTGGLVTLVTKSGTNQLRGSARYLFRGNDLGSWANADDGLGDPSNIDSWHQLGGSLGGPIVKDKQFFFLAVDVSRRSGPLVTRFARDVSGVAAPEWGISDLASLEGPSTQFQHLFSILGKWTIQLNESNRFSIRSFYTKNNTDGFTGGRGQNVIQAAFDNTEKFENSGHNTIATWNSTIGRGFNELKVMYSYQIRPRDAKSDNPAIVITDTGEFGRRFYLPITGDGEKVTIQENFQYAFGDHDLKFGADLNAYALLNNRFTGWSAGEYRFFTLEDFQAGQPFAYIQGFGLNGVPYAEAGTAKERQRQTGLGIYAQDKWQVTPNLTLTYGLRWDGNWNPPTRSPVPGQAIWSGVGGDLEAVAPPQDAPDDLSQWGPRIGAAYAFDIGGKPAVLRASWGLYYAQLPTIHVPTGGSETGTNFCFFNPACLPAGGYPNVAPDSVPGAGFGGIPSPSVADPALKNPRVMNTTATLELNLSKNYTLTTTYAWAKSDRLRVGGFSSTQWYRNYEQGPVDQFGRTIVTGLAPLDPTLGSPETLASLGRGNFHQVVVNLNRRFADRYQFFINYAWSQNKDNASTERDVDVFFAPQDPFDIELDYGRSSLDIPHQFKFAGAAELGAGFRVGALIIARSGVPYPAYSSEDINGDGVGNQGFNNDRPVVNNSFLLERFPARQPSFFQLDMRLSKEFRFGDDGGLELLAEVFNLTNASNLYSNPAISAIVAPALDGIPQPGDIGPTGTAYRTLDQVSPGSTARAIQLGVKLRF